MIAPDITSIERSRSLRWITKKVASLADYGLLDLINPPVSNIPPAVLDLGGGYPRPMIENDTFLRIGVEHSTPKAYAIDRPRAAYVLPKKFLQQRPLC